MTRFVLAFDTATPATAVAVCRGERAWEGRHDPPPGERPGHATHLLALVVSTMRAAAAEWDDLERIVVGTGPGGFTGLRIGIATARALAQSRRLPLVGVSTLRALAEGARAAEGDAARPVLAVIDARRGEVFAGGWRGEDVLLEPAALSPDALADRVRALSAAPLAVGDGAVRFRACLDAAGAEVPADGAPPHRVGARHHCRLAAGRGAEGLAAVMPDYLRLPDAEMTRRLT